MKTLNDYMAMAYQMEIVENKEEGGFVVSYPDLPGCITCGETIEIAMENALDAKRVWIEAALEDGVEIHEPGDWKKARKGALTLNHKETAGNLSEYQEKPRRIGILKGQSLISEGYDIDESNDEIAKMFGIE